MHTSCWYNDATMKLQFHDMHCHLDFMTNGQDVAADALAAKTRLFANTVTPDGWLSAREKYSDYPNVTIGFGMHPWWVGEYSSNNLEDNAGLQQQGQQQCHQQLDQSQQQSQQQPQLQRQLSQRAEHRRQAQQAMTHEAPDSAAALAQRKQIVDLLTHYNPRIIGEIGLDLSWRHVHSRSEQLRMFKTIADWAAHSEGKLLSLHSVKATQEVIDILDQTGALQTCACIFHWFTGSSNLLHRAIQSGCYFSCGPRMLATAKGREYVKAIPVKRLLLETDAPPERGIPYSFAKLYAELESVAQSIAAIKGEESLEIIAGTSDQLLG